jgi:transcriptional regulator with XRE-family HTH domain
MALAENIKEKRLEKNMSQEHLAGIVGVTRMAICNYEEGKRIPGLQKPHRNHHSRQCYKSWRVCVLRL